MNDIESLIPQGWLFLSADFSCKTSSFDMFADHDTGSVMLVRNYEGQRAFYALESYEERDAFQLYVLGSGKTLREAVENAVEHIQKEE
jgi:hypothetical protein